MGRQYRPGEGVLRLFLAEPRGVWCSRLLTMADQLTGESPTPFLDPQDNAEP